MNEIINGDCRQVMDSLPRSSFDCLCTDPPMNLAYDRTYDRKGSKPVDMNFGDWDFFGESGRDGITKLDRRSDEEFLAYTYDWLEKANRLLNDEATVIIFMADRYISYLRHYLLYDLGFKNIIVFYWHITNPPPRFIKQNMIPSVTPCILGVKGSSRETNWLKDFSAMHNFMETPILSGSERVHPTQKPLEVVERLLEIYTNKGERVLDPFMGSGTTLVACKKMEREYLGIDISYEYCEVTKRRLAKLAEKDSNEVFM